MLKDSKVHHELWQKVYVWLKACGAKPNKNFCKREITTHPDYPSLLSLVDFLDSGGMSYKAVEADASHLWEFNYPLLALVKEAGQDYIHIIDDISAWRLEKEDPIQWTGIAVYREHNAEWENAENDICRRNEFKSAVIAIVLGLMGVVLCAAAAMKSANMIYGAFGSLSLAGLFISLLTLATELGYQSDVVKQVCGAVSHGGCEKVLKSNYASGISGVSPADAAVVHFAAQFLMYIFGSWYPPAVQLISLLAFAGLAAAAWSIYTQAFLLKKWCALCLGIVTVLVLQAGISAANIHPLTSLLPVAAYFALVLILFLALLPIKALVQTNKNNALKLAELKRWKFDENLFIAQWNSEQPVDTTVWKSDLLLGRPDAPLQITVACNPYCRPCASTHQQLDHLLRRFESKVNIQMRFLFDNNNHTERRNIAVKAILQRAVMLRSREDLQKMLTDWFDWMNYDRWLEKWPLEASPDVSDRMFQHSQWISESRINYTPTLFINGKRLPGRYTLKDMEFLVPQLAESLRDNP